MKERQEIVTQQMEEESKKKLGKASKQQWECNSRDEEGSGPGKKSRDSDVR